MGHINLNLAPKKSTELKLWFLGEILVVVLSYIASSSLVDILENDLRREIQKVNEESLIVTKNIRRLKEDVKKYEALKEEEEKLVDIIKSVKNITVSKIKRFKPLILMEHIQNLKPPGLWLKSYVDNSSESVIYISGRSLDSLIVTEFVSALRATGRQEYNPDDLRSQVYFEVSNLNYIKMREARGGNPRSSNKSKPLPIDKRLTENSSSSSDLFPEIDRGPEFTMNIIYQERNKPIILE